MKIVFDKPNEFNPFIIRIDTQADKEEFLNMLKEAFDSSGDLTASTLFEEITGVSLG